MHTLYLSRASQITRQELSHSCGPQGYQLTYVGASSRVSGRRLLTNISYNSAKSDGPKPCIQYSLTRCEIRCRSTDEGVNAGETKRL